jgi:REP element-mobilizing transposase RayT
MAHTYSRLLVHVVFSTKDRQPMLDAELKARLLPYLGGIAKPLGAILLAVNGPTDHLHLLLQHPPALAIADLVRAMKSSSSKWVHETWPSRPDFAWQEGYSAFSVSHSGRERVERYIARQEVHHRRGTFQEELLAFFERHGVSYDERYLWG